MTTKLIRIDVDSEKKLKVIMKARYDNGLAKLNVKDLSPAEALRLQFKCPSWGKVEQELRSLPKGSKR